MVFEDVKEFREAVTKYSLQKGVQLEKYINEPKKGLDSALKDLLPEVEHMLAQARPKEGQERPGQLLLVKHLQESHWKGKKTSSTYEVDQEPGRGRTRKTHANGMTIPMPRKTSFAEWFENPTSYQLPVAPTPHVSSQSSARNSNAPTSYDAQVEPPA
uniref:Uncharacterized protein n=1 Tax=Solanum tuberosum TaxID=4113 RepID=M1DR52_SOLTU